jgi:hypothetical protein
VVLGGVELVGQGLIDPIVVAELGVEPGLLRLQPEEDLRLGRAGAHVHDAPLAQHVGQDIGADPVAGVGEEAEVALRLEPANRLDEAEVALGHQLRDGDPVPAVLAGDLDDRAQVRLDELVGRLPVAGIPVEVGELELSLAGQNREPIDRRDIGAEAGFIRLVCARHCVPSVGEETLSQLKPNV